MSIFYGGKLDQLVRAIFLFFFMHLNNKNRCVGEARSRETDLSVPPWTLHAGRGDYTSSTDVHFFRTVITHMWVRQGWAWKQSFHFITWNQLREIAWAELWTTLNHTQFILHHPTSHHQKQAKHSPGRIVHTGNGRRCNGTWLSRHEWRLWLSET